MKYFIRIFYLYFCITKLSAQDYKEVERFRLKQLTGEAQLGNARYLTYNKQNLLIGSDKGKIFIHNKDNSTPGVKINVSDVIKKIEVTNKYIGILTEKEILIYKKDSLKRVKRIHFDEDILTFSISGDDVYFGGKSGRLFYHNLENKDKEGNKEVFRVIRDGYLYWITDIKIYNHQLLLCAGDFYLFNLKKIKETNKYEPEKEIENKEKDFNLCQPHGKDFYFFKSHERQLVKYDKSLSKEKVLVENIYLSNPKISKVQDSLLIFTADNNLYMFNETNENEKILAENVLLSDINYPYIAYSKLDSDSIFILQEASEVLEIALNKTVNLGTINFEPNISQLSDTLRATRILKQVSDFYKSNKDSIEYIHILGFTDELKEEDAIKLSQNRAKKIKIELSKLEIPKDKLVTIGKGKDRSNTNIDKKRVELKIISKSAIKKIISNLETKPDNLFRPNIISDTTNVFIYLDNKLINKELPPNVKIEQFEKDGIYYFKILVQILGKSKGYNCCSIKDSIIMVVNKELSITAKTRDMSPIPMGKIQKGNSFKLINYRKSEEYDSEFYDFYLYGYYIKED